MEGRYVVEVNAEIPRISDLIAGPACSFEIDEMTHDGWGPKHASRLPGIIHPKLEWVLERR